MTDNTATTLIVLGVLTVLISGATLTIGVAAGLKIRKDVENVKVKTQKITTETKDFLRKLEDII